MGLIDATIRFAEQMPVPDAMTRLGVDYLVGRTRQRLSAATPAEVRAFVADMGRHPIAEHADKANEQHYELPPAFFERVLGPRRKYSSCLYPEATTTLAQAEEFALAETLAHADLKDGQDILELGCGWGSLSLYMAERLPGARITAVSNSTPQRLFIEAEARRRGVANLRVITCDMNDFAADARFDRVVSVEMFEHMSNWSDLLARVRGWLVPGGRLFLHVFTHKNAPYRFDLADKSDWIAQHFFTGGIMPSHDLIRHFPGLFRLESEWRWSGAHYQRTAEDWLSNFDANLPAIDAILKDVYGAQARVWRQRWRWFFLATSGLFGHAGGQEWGVSHYRLAPV